MANTNKLIFKSIGLILIIAVFFVFSNFPISTKPRQAKADIMSSISDFFEQIGQTFMTCVTGQTSISIESVLTMFVIIGVAALVACADYIGAGLGCKLSIDTSSITTFIQGLVQQFKECWGDIYEKFLAATYLNEVGDTMVEKMQAAAEEGSTDVFVKDWRNFTADAQYRGEDIFRGMLYDSLNSEQGICPEYKDILTELFNPTEIEGLDNVNTRVGDISSFQLSTKCSIPDNADEFEEDFSNGGWSTFLQLSLPQNDLDFLILESLNEIEKQRTAAEEAAKLEATAGQGFLGARETCVAKIGDKCIVQGDIKTPGTIVKEPLVDWIQSNFDMVASADEIGELIQESLGDVLEWVFDAGISSKPQIPSPSFPPSREYPDAPMFSPEIDPVCSSDEDCDYGQTCVDGFCKGEGDDGLADCDFCQGVYVRGRDGGEASDCADGEECNICAGLSDTSACSTFCQHTKGSLWSNNAAEDGLGPKTFTSSEMSKYPKIFDTFDLSVPSQCECNSETAPSDAKANLGGGYTDGACHGCVPAGVGFRVCTSADWCDKNCGTITPCETCENKTQRPCKQCTNCEWLDTGGRCECDGAIDPTITKETLCEGDIRGCTWYDGGHCVDKETGMALYAEPDDRITNGSSDYYAALIWAAPSATSCTLAANPKYNTILPSGTPVETSDRMTVAPDTSITFTLTCNRPAVGTTSITKIIRVVHYGCLTDTKGNGYCAECTSENDYCDYEYKATCENECK